MPGLAGEIKARVEYLRALALRTARAARVRPGAGVHAGESRLPALLPAAAGAASCATACAPASTPRATAFSPDGREPFTMLFLGSFRHEPNRAALDWFVREVLPLVRGAPAPRPAGRGRLRPAAGPRLRRHAGHLEMLGFVEDVREPLARYAVFVCPILSGSGVRVKLLEAFAAGIPVVSTRVGAEGLASEDGGFCALADDPAAFAERVLAPVRRPRPRPPPWPPARAPKWNGTGTWPRSRAGWSRATTNWCGGNGWLPLEGLTFVIQTGLTSSTLRGYVPLTGLLRNH